MSKNTGASRFRKVNVDEFDENNYQDEAVEEVVAGPDEKEVNDLLSLYPFIYCFKLWFRQTYKIQKYLVLYTQLIVHRVYKYDVCILFSYLFLFLYRNSYQEIAEEGHSMPIHRMVAADPL